MRARFLLLAALAAAPALRPRPAAAQDVMALVHADQWAAAEQAAAHWLDPVAEKLVTYYRMLAPGAASVGEIDAFIRANPDWPGQALLARRREEALGTEPDDATALPFCRRLVLHHATTLLRCAEAEAKAGQDAAADEDVRRAWVQGVTDPALEKTFLKRWGHALRPDDEWDRFARLAAADPAAARRQIARLTKGRRAEAEAWLALGRADPKATALLAAVPAGLRHDPPLVLQELRALRRQDQTATALALWASAGDAAQRAATPGLRPAFWRERDALARDLLQAGDAAGAYRLVDDPGPITRSEALDADFLAGWIALRRLHRPDAAARHFAALAAASGAAITQGRAHFWLGRAAAASGDAARATAEYRKAAAWPTTFYGQLAALALGEDVDALDARIRALREPGWDTAQAVGFASREVARAAALLVAWGDPRRARPFLLRLEELAPDDADRAMAARFAIGLGLPAQAVAIARRAGVDGLILAAAGWPLAVDPPAGPVDPDLTLGLIRQESSFDIQAVSPAGARGLMQLMPATAADLAHRLGQRVSTASLTADPQENMRLGTAYVAQLLARFGGSLPLAIAAYNAGPHRVDTWLAGNGDPRTGAIDMVDWIELIPFPETRNYVQRVIENVVVYRALRGVTAPPPVKPAAPGSKS